MNSTFRLGLSIGLLSASLVGVDAAENGAVLFKNVRIFDGVNAELRRFDRVHREHEAAVSPSDVRDRIHFFDIFSGSGADGGPDERGGTIWIDFGQSSSSAAFGSDLLPT